ncbi:MAG: hypothetical protein QOH23_258 [Gaiellaceae bacterium]|nr:hypothetical protein [Gaiellaceae bacterium]
MGGWYWIGVLAGLGAAFGVFVAGLVPRLPVAAVVAAVAAVALGLLVFDWDEAVGGVVGGLLGGAAAATVVAGALRRGGTRAGTAALVGLGAAAVAALAFVPVLGFVEAAVLPALAIRLRKREPERYAGLRTLARD